MNCELYHYKPVFLYVKIHRIDFMMKFILIANRFAFIKIQYCKRSAKL